MTAPSFEIAGRTIGADSPPWIVAAPILTSVLRTSMFANPAAVILARTWKENGFW